jgi:hypothetical protein
VDREDDNNYYSKYAFEVDGAPGNTNTHIIPGLNIQLIPCPHWAQKSNIVVGGIWDDTEGRAVIPQRFGYIPGGTNSATQVFKIKNVTGDTLENIKVRTLNRVLILQKNEEAVPFVSVRHNDCQDPIGYTSAAHLGITFSDLDTSTTPSTITMLIDGESHDVIDTTDDTVMVNGKKLKLDGTTEYIFGENSSYSGLSFILSSSTDDDSVATIFVSPGGDLWRIRENGDTDWTRGNDGLSLDDLADDATVEIDVQCSPRRGVDQDYLMLEGILYVEGDTGSMAIVLSMIPIEGTLQVLNLRTTVIPQAVYDKMSEFGVIVS